MKHYFYKMLLFSGILIANSSCEQLDITDNQRILIRGHVVDQNGNPLENISLHTESLNKIIASAPSDASGNFEMTSLNANYNPLKILVNLSHSFDDQNAFPDYSSRIYSSDMANQDLLIDLGTIVLSEIGTLSIYLRNESRSNNLEYTLSYTSKVCHLPLSGSENNPCELDRIENRSYGPTAENQNISRESVLGTVAIFEYSLNNEATQTIEIPVTNPPTNYVFEY
ncbi:MAG: carboxypeptidase-like regulatory domain-containing protein [Aequorivita sp.]